mmetsp:Transcript_12069/g.50526  ORF Transcript_12069/g.50526 Transcript_12069/m.50526 type:complete len:308 (+) Transcript_12069:487-1410(+)
MSTPNETNTPVSLAPPHRGPEPLSLVSDAVLRAHQAVHADESPSPAGDNHRRRLREGDALQAPAGGRRRDRRSQGGDGEVPDVQAPVQRARRQHCGVGGRPGEVRDIHGAPARKRKRRARVGVAPKLHRPIRRRRREDVAREGRPRGAVHRPAVPVVRAQVLLAVRARALVQNALLRAGDVRRRVGVGKVETRPGAASGDGRLRRLRRLCLGTRAGRFGSLRDARQAHQIDKLEPFLYFPLRHTPVGGDGDQRRAGAGVAAANHPPHLPHRIGVLSRDAAARLQKRRTRGNARVVDAHRAVVQTDRQ